MGAWVWQTHGLQCKGVQCNKTSDGAAHFDGAVSVFLVTVDASALSPFHSSFTCPQTGSDTHDCRCIRRCTPSFQGLRLCFSHDCQPLMRMLEAETIAIKMNHTKKPGRVCYVPQKQAEQLMTNRNASAITHVPPVECCPGTTIRGKVDHRLVAGTKGYLTCQYEYNQVHSA